MEWLTNEFHPTQMLADFLTIKENFGHLKGLKLVFCGDGRNNVANSLMVACSKLGVNYTLAAPKSLWPDENLVNICKDIAISTNCQIEFEEDIIKATKDANCIYTDVWVSMGEADNIWEERLNLLKNYQVNMNVLNNASQDVIFLHCLPSFHDLNTTIGEEIYKKFGLKEMEVTDEVFRSKYSKVFDEAENRMHTIKAVMYATLKDKDE